MTTPIPHEGRFLRALGVSPETVVANTTRLEWRQEGAVLLFTAAHLLDAKTLGAALMMAAQDPEEQTGPVPMSDEEIAQGYEDAGSHHNEEEGDGGETT